MQKIGVKDWKRINPPRMTSRNRYCEIAWLLTHSRRATCRSPLPYKEPASGIPCIRYQASLLSFQSVFCVVNLYCYQAVFFGVCRGFCFRMGKNAWGFALVAVFMAVGAVAQAPSPSSSSSSDCISAITTLSPCLSFAATNSNQTKPGNDCCTAFSSVVSTKAICLCQLISGNNSLELPINRTKALTLPGACNVKTPPVSECAAAGAPLTSFGVPVSSPALSPQTSKAPAKAPAASTPAPTKATPTPTSATPAAAPVLAPVTTVSPPLPAPTPSPSGSPAVSSPPAGSPAHSVSSSPVGPSSTTSGGTPAGSPGGSAAPGSSASGSTATAIFTPSTLLVLVGVALAGVQW